MLGRFDQETPKGKEVSIQLIRFLFDIRKPVRVASHVAKVQAFATLG
jgi:hypothetical protein